MKSKELFDLLNSVQENEDTVFPKRHDKVLLIDGLNLFFRNFAMLNIVNSDGIHIGGLGRTSFPNINPNVTSKE